MQAAYQRLVDLVVHYRRRLADVEARRARCAGSVPEAVWQELAESAHHLEQAEEGVRQACRQVSAQVSQGRASVAAALDEYNTLRERMRRSEELFLLNVLRPARHLKRAVQQRQLLESEYQRMLAAVQREGYPDQPALEADIRAVLARGNLDFSPQEEPGEQEQPPEDKPLAQFDADDLLDALAREELAREFRRVVLPAVHPDTSQTSPEVFKTVFEVYKQGDWLLMEAYLVQYRGEPADGPKADPLEALDQALALQERLQRLLRRLQGRLARLKADLTAQEIDDPQKVEHNLLRQRQEILARINAEAERILELRIKIEGLLDAYRARTRGQA